MFLSININSNSCHIQGDSKLLLVFPWPVNGNPDNNVELLCISTNTTNSKKLQREKPLSPAI
jgi:hypothetical protein